jgi:hypothetical protein
MPRVQRRRHAAESDRDSEAETAWSIRSRSARISKRSAARSGSFRATEPAFPDTHESRLRPGLWGTTFGMKCTAADDVSAVVMSGDLSRHSRRRARSPVSRSMPNLGAILLKIASGRISSRLLRTIATRSPDESDRQIPADRVLFVSRGSSWTRRVRCRVRLAGSGVVVGALGTVAMADLGDGGHVDGVVESTVAAPRQAEHLAPPLTRGHLDRCGAVVGSEPIPAGEAADVATSPMNVAATIGPDRKAR